MRDLKTITLDDARRVIAAAEHRAEAIGSPSNVAVVDVGGALVAHIRMDDAQLGSIEHSIDKAFTSAFYRAATVDLAPDTRPDGQFWGMALSNHGRVLVFAGGVPLTDRDGTIVGAVGVSGGTQHQDATVADAAASALRTIDA